MTTMAVNVMAKAPFGHAVTIQKISAALMAANVRPALTKAGHQSATWSLARRPASACRPALRSASEPPRRRAVACPPGRPPKVKARPDEGPTATVAEYCAAPHRPGPEPRDPAFARAAPRR